MTIRKLLFSFAGSATVCLAVAGASLASVPRAFVSINGSDLNPCSATQPCRSFNQALTVVQPGGEIVVQNSGGYSTGFTITQSVTIDAAGSNASVISTSSTDLCTINAGPSDRVVLRGISFHGASVGGSAIHATQVGSLYVEHCSISEFNGDGVRTDGGSLWVTDTTVRACSVGIEAAPPTSHLVVQDSLISESTDTGVNIGTGGNPAPATALLVNCTAALAKHGTGFGLQSNNSADVDMMLVNCRSFGNSIGLQATGQSTGNVTVRMTGCALTGNAGGIIANAFGTGVASVVGTGPGTNFITGNTTDGSTTGSVTLAIWMQGPWDIDRLPSKSDPCLPPSALASDRRRPERATASARKDWSPITRERT